jgi:hypothetical protein
VRFPAFFEDGFIPFKDGIGHGSDKCSSGRGEHNKTDSRQVMGDLSWKLGKRYNRHIAYTAGRPADSTKNPDRLKRPVQNDVVQVTRSLVAGTLMNGKLNKMKENIVRWRCRDSVKKAFRSSSQLSGNKSQD